MAWRVIAGPLILCASQVSSSELGLAYGKMPSATGPAAGVFPGVYFARIDGVNIRGI